MKHSELKKLLEIENRLVYNLDKYRDYNTDLTLSDDDYSVQYLLSQALYSFDIYSRAIINTNNIKNKNFIFLKDQIIEITSEVNSSKNIKNTQFFKEYFSYKRLNRLFQNLEKSTINIDASDSVVNKNIDLAVSIAKLIDNCNLASNTDDSVFNKISNVFSANFEGFDKVRKRNAFLLNYYADHLSLLVEHYLIPNNPENKWWYQIQPLTEKSIETAFFVYYEKQNQNSYVAELVVELGDKSSKVFNEIKDEIENALDWGRGNLDSFDAMLNQFMNNKQTSPAYATWSDSENKPALSDHAMPAVLLKRISSISDEIIIELIGLAKDPDSELEESKRNQIIATAYLMIGETQKALDILDNE